MNRWHLLEKFSTQQSRDGLHMSKRDSQFLSHLKSWTTFLWETKRFKSLQIIETCFLIFTALFGAQSGKPCRL